MSKPTDENLELHLRSKGSKSEVTGVMSIAFTVVTMF